MRFRLAFANAARRLRWATAAVAATVLLWAPSAHACSYSQMPEPVGHASAEFFAARMAPEATFVDVAVAESTSPPSGPETPWTVRKTTFRVVYRLKGQSPDRFSLYVGELQGGEAIPEARHFVDETGRVSPYPYPHEGIPGQPDITNSCDPGTLRVRLGQAYLIFREADGRLLDRVQVFDDRVARLFPIMPVSLDEDIGWLQAGLVATVPEREPREKAPASNLAAVRFDRGLTEAEAVQWVRRAAVRPTAVFIGRGRLVEEHRVPIDRAAVDLVSQAMSQGSRREGGDRLAALARQFLDETDETLSLALGLQLRARLLLESAIAEPSSDVPARVVAMEVTGAPEALARLKSAPGVAETAPGFVLRGRAAAPILVRGAAPAFPYQADGTRETAESLRRRLRALIEGRPVPEPELVPPDPPVDPFSYTGCIRIGETEAVALNLPLMAPFGEFTLYALPQTADCTQTAEALTCRLAPRSAVRLDVRDRIGGFRVGPDPARFEVRGSGIMCGRETETRGAS